MKKKSTTFCKSVCGKKSPPHALARAISSLRLAWRQTAFSVALALCFSPILFGCSISRQYLSDADFYVKDPQTRAEIMVAIVEIKKKNRDLKTFKGIGKIRFQGDGVSQVARAAWMGSVPKKFYISVLAPAGPPVARFAGDGSAFYIAMQNGSKVYKKRYKNGIETAAIKRFLPIPIDFEDLVLFLGGQVPMPNRLRARFCRNKKEPGQCLIIEDLESREIQRIYFDKEKKTIKKMVAYTPKGRLKYRARFEKIKKIGDFSVPMNLFFSDGMGTDFSLRIERYWANIPVSPEHFALQQPAAKPQVE